MEALEEKFKRLALEYNTPKNVSSSALKPLSFEAELKSMTKEISNFKWDQDKSTAQRIKTLLNAALVIYKKESIPSANCSENEEKLSNALLLLKCVGEAPMSKEAGKNVNESSTEENENEQKFRDYLWDDVLSPNLAEIYDYLSNYVLQYCHMKNMSSVAAGRSSGDCHSVSAGFAHYQLLGLLQDTLRTVLVYLKRQFLNYRAGKDAEINQSLNILGSSMCNFLDSSVGIGLDTRCNMGLGICYILLLCNFKGNKAELVEFLKKMFREEKLSPQKCEDFLAVVLSTAEKDVNRIGFAIGFMNLFDLKDKDVDLSEILYLITKNVIGVDHGTKECVNLGTARVLEMLTDKMTDPFIPAKIIETISPLFGSIEFFVFSYIPGHIDAVKNCTRNILGSLTKIYDRISNEKLLPNENSNNLIDSLLRTILTKDEHVKWIGLACVARNSSSSISIWTLDSNIPISLLCAKHACKNAANESYINLMLYDFVLVPENVWEKRWIVPLFATQSNLINNESNWQQKRAIITNIFNSKKSAINAMSKPLLKHVISKMNTTQSSAEISESTLLAAETIKIASELGVKIDLEPNVTNTEELFRGFIPRHILNSWLWNDNSQIRLAGFSLLVETKKTSEIISYQDFDSMKIVLKYNMVSQNSAFRQLFMSYFKKLLVRFRDSQALLKRKKQVKELERYNEFLLWTWKFLTEDEGYFNGANFGRRCQALECLTELICMFKDLSLFGVHSDNAHMKYFSWLTDTHDTNKKRALEILIKMPIPAFQDEEICKRIFEEAMALCDSVKPPESITGRYLMVLLMKKTESSKYSPLNLCKALFDKLEETFALIGKTSLTEVACEKPMYGLIHCIKMILNFTDDYLKDDLEVYKTYFEKLINLFLKLSDIMFPLLGNAAPEGFLPGLPDSSEENTHVVRSIKAQMLLVCSWRSVRDICLLFTDMCILLPLEGERQDTKKNPSGNFILSYDQILIIGDHLLHLLKNLVHRGVFEQVFVGFKIFATRLWKSSNPKLCALPLKWLSDAMDEEHMSSKCITRRSAGLPFIFQALLSAECNNASFLSTWVQKLFVKDESPKSCQIRIHSMNVLRGLFRDALFSRSMMPHVPDGLRIAFRGLKSENWTERNAGLMLYGAVIRRTFGPKLNLMSAPTFFRRFPQMYDYLLEELKVCLQLLESSDTEMKQNNNDSSEFTFHLLLLLSSFAPAGRVEDDHFKLSEFVPKLRQCATSRNIEVRKLAAKAIIPFLNSPSDYSVVLNIISHLKAIDFAKCSTNLIHGDFVQIIEIVNFHVKDKTSEEIIVQNLHELFTPQLWSHIKCPTVFEAIAEIFMTFENYENPLLKSMYSELTRAYIKLYNHSAFPQRNVLPGLPVADSTIFKGQILFTLSQKLSDLDSMYGLLYDCLTQFKNVTLIEQLVELLCLNQNSNFLNTLINTLPVREETTLIIDSLITCYLVTCAKYVGQSDLDFKFLELLTKINPETLDAWVKSIEAESETPKSFICRLFKICVDSSATTEHKRLSLIILSKFAFRTDIELTQKEKERLSLLFVEWSEAAMDDDLRYGTALSIPCIPFDNLQNLSTLDQLKIWISIFKLAQDDDPQIRSIINNKISNVAKVHCDRKSIEDLVALFFSQVIKSHPMEGLTLLFGLLLKEDSELGADKADDEEEGRLFDKSEMNMFYEPITLAKIIKEYLNEEPDLLAKLKLHFHSSLTVQISEIYELASNSKLFVCSPSLETIVNMAKMKLNYDNINEIEDESETGKSFCIPTTSAIRNKVKLAIVTIIEEMFL